MKRSGFLRILLSSRGVVGIVTSATGVRYPRTTDGGSRILWNIYQPSGSALLRPDDVVSLGIVFNKLFDQ